MDNRDLVENWRARLIQQCQQRLDRELTPKEQGFITSRGSFIALEAIDDTVKTLRGLELESYLNSEND
jgi:hypothetical protein